MKNKSYGTALSLCYDKLNDGIDIVKWADFITNISIKHSKIKVKNICELACGTGNMSIELAKRGYHLTSLDLSEEMLSVADMKTRNENLEVRYTLQDMSSFSLFTKADLIICLLDSINYLTKPTLVRSTFERAFLNLSYGGLFIFDINSKYKFENIYSDNAYILENEGILCAWQNFYNKKSKICDFCLSIFNENDDGNYSRTDEEQKEKMYTQKQITKFLTDSGFLLLGVYSNFDFKIADENSDERLYFVAIKDLI